MKYRNRQQEFEGRESIEVATMSEGVPNLCAADHSRAGISKMHWSVKAKPVKIRLMAS